MNTSSVVKFEGTSTSLSLSLWCSVAGTRSCSPSESVAVARSAKQMSVTVQLSAIDAGLSQLSRLLYGCDLKHHVPAQRSRFSARSADVGGLDR